MGHSSQDDKWMSFLERRVATTGVARPRPAGGRTSAIIYLFLAEYAPTVRPSRDAAAYADLGPNLGDIMRVSVTPPRRYRTRRRWSGMTSAASSTTPISSARDRRTTEAAIVGGATQIPDERPLRRCLGCVRKTKATGSSARQSRSQASSPISRRSTAAAARSRAVSVSSAVATATPIRRPA